MKSLYGMLWLALVCAAQLSYGQHVVYTSPVPGSSMVSRQTNIVLRYDADIDRATLLPALIEVEGRKSGLHAGTFALSDDEQTLLFTPDQPFEPGEDVKVTLHDGIRTAANAPVEPVTYSFTTTSLRVPLTEQYYVDHAGALQKIENVNLASAPAPMEFSSPLDSLPPDFPTFKIDTVDNPSPGYFFLASEEVTAGNGYFIFMIDNSGNVVRYKRSSFPALDFKQQRNGLFSYAESYNPWGYAGGGRTVHRIVDSTLAPVDSFRCGNGYDADSHEFLMLPNGHVLLHAYDIQYMDLSGVVTGGNPNAIVVGSILQELDLSRNVVFQWRSWDYVPISDTYNNVASAGFDYIHVNAYDVDLDGNILASFRVTCQLLKINRMTGDIMWRLGGRRNEFTFIGENPAYSPNYISYPHSVRSLPNGNILLFDNGNQHPTPASRAIEYQLDQVNKTATLIWEYRHTPDLFAPQMGSVQRLANGNTLIGWGNASAFSSGKQACTEVRPDKSVAFEMEFLDHTISYRIQKYVLASQTTAAASINVFDVQPGSSYDFRRGDSVLTGVSMHVLQGSSGYSNVSVKRYESAPSKPSFTGLPPFVQPQRWVIRALGLTGYTVDVTFDSTALGMYARKSNAVMFARDAEGAATFLPLASVYDSVLHSLTVTVSKFGEFIVGVPEQVSAPPVPGLVLPEQNAKTNQALPILLRWSTSGHLTGSHLQIATDSLFTVMIVDDSILKSSAYVWSGAASGTSYFWRSLVLNELGTSGWSAAGRFNTAAPYITLTSPQPGDKFAPGSTTIIRWESNLNTVGTFVSIRLYRNGVFQSKINDSTAGTGRYSWRLGTALATDSTYTVRVRLVTDTTFYAESGVFRIAPVTGVDQDPALPYTFELDQNYPNPFNPGTTIRFRVPGSRAAAAGSSSDGGQSGGRTVRLAVYDPLGREVAVLMEGRKDPGEYSVTFDGGRCSSGVYFYRLQVRQDGVAGIWENLATKAMVLVK